MIQFLLLALLIFATILQATVITVPLTIALLLLFYIVFPSDWLFVVAFVCGILLDTLAMQPLGATSLYFCLFLYIAALYNNKFEILNMRFVVVATFFGSFFYLFLFGYSLSAVQAGINALFALALFSLLVYGNSAGRSDPFALRSPQAL